MSTIVTVDEVARRLGLFEALEPHQRQVVSDAIVDCQADVEAQLNRSLVPSLYQLVGEQPLPGWADLNDAHAYLLHERYDDVVAVVGRVPNEDDSEAWDLTVRVGLDGSSCPPIVRFVTAHAVETLRLNPITQRVLGLETAMTTVSSEGQSITPVLQPTTGGTAGSLPSWDSIKRYRRVPIFRRARPARAPWPYLGS